MMLEKGQRWLLDALPAELSEQVFMQLREEGLEHSQEGQQEWGCSRWELARLEEQVGTMSWKGGCWGQQGAEETEGGQDAVLSGVLGTGVGTGQPQDMS